MTRTAVYNYMDAAKIACLDPTGASFWYILNITNRSLNLPCPIVIEDLPKKSTKRASAALA